MSETKELASYVVGSRNEDLPGDVRHKARRAILNCLGCAIGGSREPAVEILIGAPFAVLGRALDARFWRGRNGSTCCTRR
jgi:2-methylcitrate dehydratase PrpD